MDVNKVYRAFQNRFRPRRMRQMALLTGITAESKVLDIGGHDLNWNYLTVKPDLTILNIEAIQMTSESARQVMGDGCKLPFGDKTFDLAFSNSVIEHVPDQKAFADEILRVGRSYYVQTPNFWFPIEPHFLAPVIHYLPTSWRRKLGRRFTGWGLIAKPSQTEVDDFVESTHLLKTSEMQGFFPKSRIEREKVLGLTKSVIVVGGDIP